MANNIIEVTDMNFDQEVLQSDKPVVVDFWAPWCGPCRMLAPIFEQLAQQYGDKIKFVKVNVDENPTSAIRFNIRGIPTVMIFKN
jgi:thioredoxin 1